MLISERIKQLTARAEKAEARVAELETERDALRVRCGDLARQLVDADSLHLADESSIYQLRSLLKRTLTPLRFASMHYLDNGLLDQENRTDALVESIKRAIKH